ncbi:hypothetical protein [Arsenicicoccus sp. oral taxon 190]|uniref:hypothetical protein n=1 Tax=Arsenicicoccus sp. oral taxon 190 TaxID=1658671 RepID=UPI00155DD5A3|nr:hypothetical protein [Arsenicicoccus sp. oral taxon 190]
MRHHELIRASHMAHEGRLVTSGVSACLWHGLPVDLRDLDRLLLTRRRAGEEPPGAHGASTSRVLIRSHTCTEEVEPDAPVLTPAAAIVEYALQSGLPAGVAAADAALARGLVEEREIQDAILRRARRRGIRRVATLLTWVEPQAENAGESRARFALMQAGFDLESQVELETPGGLKRLDWRVRGTACGIELHGADKYVDGDGTLLRSRIRAQRRRDRDVQSTGHTLVDLTMDDITDIDLLRALVIAESAGALDRPTPAPWRPAGMGAA